MARKARTRPNITRTGPASPTPGAPTRPPRAAPSRTAKAPVTRRRGRVSTKDNPKPTRSLPRQLDNSRGSLPDKRATAPLALTLTVHHLTGTEAEPLAHIQYTAIMEVLQWLHDHPTR